MTEQEWLNCADPTPMLAFPRGRTSERKWRLFGVACCRRLCHLVTADAAAAIELIEQYAEGQISLADVQVGFAFWSGGISGAQAGAHQTLSIVLHDVVRAAEWAARSVGMGHAYAMGTNEAWRTGRYEVEAHEREWQTAALRDIVGNPFRVVRADPAWLTWHRGTVRVMASGLYEEHRFTEVPILADALEDAGCDNADILEHCRAGGPHVRGCWVLDLLLGKE